MPVQHRFFAHASRPVPIQESVAADVRRLCSVGFLQSEPPYVGCYHRVFLESTLGPPPQPPAGKGAFKVETGARTALSVCVLRWISGVWCPDDSGTGVPPGVPPASRPCVGCTIRTGGTPVPLPWRRLRESALSSRNRPGIRPRTISRISV